jgi:Na+/melibiose symporter-like transporter
MTTRSQKLSIKEKVGYALGDLSANLIFQTLFTFLAFFILTCIKFRREQQPLLFFRRDL